MDVEAILQRLWTAASSQGTDWLNASVNSLLQGTSGAPSQAPQDGRRPRRTRPPARLSPDIIPRARRRNMSPSADPPVSSAVPSTSQRGAGRNPPVRRGLQRGVDPSSPPSVSGRRGAAGAGAGTAAVSMPAGAAQRGRQRQPRRRGSGAVAPQRRGLCGRQSAGPGISVRPSAVHSSGVFNAAAPSAGGGLDIASSAPSAGVGRDFPAAAPSAGDGRNFPGSAPSAGDGRNFPGSASSAGGGGNFPDSGRRHSVASVRSAGDVSVARSRTSSIGRQDAGSAFSLSAAPGQSTASPSRQDTDTAARSSAGNIADQAGRDAGHLRLGAGSSAAGLTAPRQLGENIFPIFNLPGIVSPEARNSDITSGVASGGMGLILRGLGELAGLWGSGLSRGSLPSAAWLGNTGSFEGSRQLSEVTGTSSSAGPAADTGSSSREKDGTAPGPGSGIDAPGEGALQDKEKEDVPQLDDAARGEVYVCFEGPLGAHLKQEVREKIWKGEYIEIFSLLPLERFNLDRPRREDSKKEDEEKRRYRLIPRSFSNWLQAFAIMASVIGEKAPENCSALFCYLDAIGEAYRTYGGQGWLRYDEQFRQRKAFRPSI
ncbi:unnamed protein product, partial [Ranitomeya imitator]